MNYNNFLILGPLYHCHGRDNCCSEEHPCHAGEGDCDFDSDCQAGLECGSANCFGPGFETNDDCCQIPQK